MKPWVIAAICTLVAAPVALAQANLAPASPQIAAAIADSARPDGDRAQDIHRKPAQTIAFAGIEPGQTVVELLPGQGYYTRILARVVGPQGKVICIPWSEFATGASYAKANDARYGNIEVFGENLLAFRPARQVDVIFTTQNYHDFQSPQRPQINQVLFKALKPGGTYFLLDHSGKAGSGFRSLALHRIDKDLAIKEVTAAGFVLVAQNDTLLANPADDRTLNVFNPTIRGQTDQFLLKFIKPVKPTPTP